MADRIIPQFPHCDPRVLHAPGECEYCDAHPDWQELRRMWSINFTGNRQPYSDEYRNEAMLPCPSEVARPLNSINQWDGNVPMKKGRVNTKAPMFEGKTVHHDRGTRHVEVTDIQKPDALCLLCKGTGEMDSGGVEPWEQGIMIRCSCTYPDYPTVTNHDEFDHKLHEIDQAISKLHYDVQQLKFRHRGKK